MPNDRGLTPGIPFSEIQLTPENREHSDHAHSRGWMWHLYDIKAPLAWKFSTGAPDVVIAAYDYWGADDFDHPDLPLRTTPQQSGQFIVVDAAHRGDGSETSVDRRGGHGLTTLPLAVAAGNNDDGTPGTGMLGVAHSCRGVALHAIGTLGPKILELDTDLEQNNELQPVAVLNASIGSVELPPLFSVTAENFLPAINAGIVVVSGACNARDYENGQCGIPRNFQVNGEQRRTWYPGVSRPAAHVYADPDAQNDPSRDVRIIAVGALNDGGPSPCQDPLCNPGLSAAACDYNNGWLFRGSQTFIDNWNFSPGKDKFNLSSDPTERLEAKRRAFLDLAAPGQYITTPAANDGGAIFSSGTSQSAPVVSGVVGLMLAVDRWAGVDLEHDQNGDLLNGADVQRRVHDVLTMTADKLPDYCNIGPQWPRCDGSDGDPNVEGDYFSGVDGNDELIQFDYLEQANDPRRRSWAQRMGFGKVNAYRAVAHTISLKADQRYTASVTLPFDNDERGPLGQRIMHMGAWFREGANEDVNGNGLSGEVLDLYEAGGASLPGENHNNQGVTELNGSGVTLTVPGDATLAIDGIVTSGTPTGGNGITTTGDGEIVAEGMLDNVELSGDTFVGDLIVRGDEGTNGCLMAGPAQANVCEVFGNVRMQDSGAVFVRGWMRMRPGGQITMSGGRDVFVKPGGTLEMMYGSRIERDPGTHFDRMVVIDAGATLLVQPGAHVDLFTHIYVLPGGRVEIGENAVVSLDHFRVEADGEFVVGAGAHLALRDPDYFNECQGHMTVAGQAGNLARVTGRFPEVELANPYVLCDGVVDHARLIAKGDIDDIAASGLRLENAAFSNVAVQAINIRINTVSNCSFTAARSLNMPWQNLVEVNYWPGDGDPITPPPALNARFEDCEFADEDGEDDNSSNRMLQEYKFHGLFSMNLESLALHNSNFRAVEAGIRTIDAGSVDLTGNRADIVDNFIHINGPRSESFECGNTAQSVWRCGTYTATAQSRVYDAAYANIHSGIIGTSADRVWMRGSHLDFFMEGVNADGGTIYLRPNENPGQVDEFGRNVFVVQPRNQPQSEFFDSDLMRRDAHMQSYGSVIPPCGLNNFAAETDLHIDANYFAMVLVTSNRWNNPDGTFNVRRGPLVQVLGDQLDQSESTMGCATDEDFQSCPSPPELQQLGSLNPFGPVMDNTPDSIFVRALDDLADPTLLPTVRRTRAKDTFRAALKGDSTEQRLDTLRGWIGTILAADTTVANDTLLRGGLMLLDGVILEHLRRYPDARIAFELVCQSVPSSPDSMLAGWRLKKLDLLECGQTHGAAYDSKMAAWNGQINQDLERYRTPPLQQAKRAGETGPVVDRSDCRLSGISPNPFGDKTTIRVEVGSPQHLRIEIADMQGRIVAVIADRRLESGSHELVFRNEAYAPGVYLCRMQTAGGHSQSELMFIE